MIVWDSQTTLSSLWKLCMLEKIYHHSNNPNLSTPIRKLGTVMPHGVMTKLIVQDAAMWKWWTFSTTLLDVNGVMAIVSTHHFIYMVYLYTGPSSVRTNTTRNASYSNEIVFLSTLKVTFSIYNLPKHFNYWSLFFFVQTDCYYTIYWSLRAFQDGGETWEWKGKSILSPTFLY